MNVAVPEPALMEMEKDLFYEYEYIIYKFSQKTSPAGKILYRSYKYWKAWLRWKFIYRISKNCSYLFVKKLKDSPSQYSDTIDQK